MSGSKNLSTDFKISATPLYLCLLRPVGFFKVLKETLFLLISNSVSDLLNVVGQGDTPNPNVHKGSFNLKKFCCGKIYII